MTLQEYQTELPRLRLKAGREKPLLRRHPWVYSGAVAGLEGEPESGDTIEIVDAKGQFLARAGYSPQSQIRARVWSWQADAQVDAVFFADRLAQAQGLRKALPELAQTDACRLVHGESDGLPGIIADRYGTTLVVQLLTAPAERWRAALAPLFAGLPGVESVYERSDADVRALEGLPPRSGVLSGPEPPARLAINENGLRYWVDVRQGHKTGFYLDQRANRARLRTLAAGREVLDCFAYTGGFTLAALAGGAAQVTAVESSAPALELARANLALNGLPAERVEWVEGDVFQALRGYRDRRRSFDLIILDPPKFAPTAAQADKAARGYKDINLLAFKLLRPGGLLVTFSCSGGVDEALFQKIVAGAALDAGAEAQLIERLGQASDHPVALNFPEGAYLKGFVLVAGRRSPVALPV